jgi:hypothetical protein
MSREAATSQVAKLSERMEGRDSRRDRRRPPGKSVAATSDVPGMREGIATMGLGETTLSPRTFDSRQPVVSQTQPQSTYPVTRRGLPDRPPTTTSESTIIILFLIFAARATLWYVSAGSGPVCFRETWSGHDPAKT